MSHRATLYSHLFELAVALAFAILGVAYLIDPQAAVLSPVGRYVGHWQYAWSLFYIIACAMIWNGIFMKSCAERVAGLILLGTGLAMHGIAAVTSHLEIRDAVYFLYSAVAFTRVYWLLHVFPREKS